MSWTWEHLSHTSHPLATKGITNIKYELVLCGHKSLSQHRQVHHSHPLSWLLAHSWSLISFSVKQSQHSSARQLRVMDMVAVEREDPETHKNRGSFSDFKSKTCLISKRQIKNFNRIVHYDINITLWHGQGHFFFFLMSCFIGTKVEDRNKIFRLKKESAYRCCCISCSWLHTFQAHNPETNHHVKFMITTWVFVVSTKFSTKGNSLHIEGCIEC